VSVKLDRLTANPPPDQPDQFGQDDGETCGRYPEPDEDAPRGYKPKPCQGVMQEEYPEHVDTYCDTCGEIGY